MPKERVEITIHALMDDDMDLQNGLGLAVLSAFAKIADQYGVDLHGGETWCQITLPDRERT